MTSKLDIYVFITSMLCLLWMFIFDDLVEIWWNNLDLLVVNEWLLFNAYSAIFQLYHDKNKLIFQWNDDEVCFILD